jgi:hypothetical protein
MTLTVSFQLHCTAETPVVSFRGSLASTLTIHVTSLIWFCKHDDVKMTEAQHYFSLIKN